MRLSRSLAPATTVALCLALSLPYEAMPYEAMPYEAKSYGAKSYEVKPYEVKASGAKSYARVEAPGGARKAGVPEPFGAVCSTRITGSRVTAYCHNPYPLADRVSLHVECDRWWDVDSDTASVVAGPTQTVRLTGRCWKEIRSAWVSHEKQTRFRQAP